MPTESSKNGGLVFVLCLIFGVFGAHRFYVGKVGTGILQLLTFGGLGVWALIDLAFVVFSEFTDGQGLKVNTWKGL